VNVVAALQFVSRDRVCMAAACLHGIVGERVRFTSLSNHK
jgi:hypothetical protein